jgi:hypothetical protein
LFTLLNFVFPFPVEGGEEEEEEEERICDA